MEKNILIINHWGKLSPRLTDEKWSLSKKYNVEVVFWNRTEEREQNSEDSIQLRAPVASLKLLFKLPKLYWKIYKKIQPKQINVIHCTHFLLLPLALVIKLFKGVNVVYDAYERYSIDISTAYFSIFSWFARIIFELVENILVRFTDGVLTIDSVNNLLENRYRSYQPNTEVLYNVPNLVKRSSTKINNAKNLRQKNNSLKNTICYVGSLIKRKGILEAIKSLDIVVEKEPNIELLLIGTFKSNETKKKSLNLIHELGLEEKIMIMEWMPYKDMMNYLEACAIGLAPHQRSERYKYISKGTGRKFFTYMEASLPIIGPNFYRIADIVRETNCGILVDTTKPEEIAKAILYLVNNPKKSESFGRKGRIAIEKRYNWSIEEKKLFKVYSSL